jgi:hypothetical protein
MSHKFLLKSSFHELLKSIDYDLSEQERAKGCTFCGGNLHRSDYPRSPLGVPIEHREHYEERYSHCCSRCRKRTTSQSVRFFGRFWFPGPLFLLISALMHGAINKCRLQLYRLFGVSISKKTCKRWKRWWKYSFIATKFWKGVTGLIPIDCLHGPFPRKLFSMYKSTNTECTDAFPQGKAYVHSVAGTYFAQRLVSVLKFVSPLTAGVLRAV